MIPVGYLYKVAVKSLKENGYKVALCSGRALVMAQKVPVFDDIAWDGFIGGGGNFVYDKDDHLLWENAFTKSQLEEIFRIGKKHHLAMFVTGESIFLTRDLTKEEEQLLDIFHMEKPKHIHDWNGEEVHMLSIITEKGFDFSIFDHIPNILLQASCDEIIDLVVANGNKAKGISHLLTHLGIEQGAYVAFGDNLNDVEMLEEAAIGVAMGNCTPSLKDHADRVCAPSNEPGIYDTLKELGLI